VEVVSTKRSELLSRTLREVHVRTLFDAGVVSIRRRDWRLTGQAGRITVRVGDGLLPSVGLACQRRKTRDRHFHVVGNAPSLAVGPPA
jgi:uncharacterized protein with PhoU and TrkA domain